MLTIHKLNNGMRGLFVGSLPERGVGAEVFGVVRWVEINSATLAHYWSGAFQRERGVVFQLIEYLDDFYAVVASKARSYKKMINCWRIAGEQFSYGIEWFFLLFLRQRAGMMGRLDFNLSKAPIERSHQSRKVSKLRSKLMPPKIRELIADLEHSGFVNRGGKGSHRNFVHPRVAKPVTISGSLGDDAKHYQIRAVNRALKELKS